MKKLILLLCATLGVFSVKAQTEVAFSGNAYVQGDKTGGTVSKTGATLSGSDTQVSLYFKPTQTKSYPLYIKGTSSSKVTLEAEVTSADKTDAVGFKPQRFSFELKPGVSTPVKIGTFKSTAGKYVKLSFSCKKNSGNINLESLLLGEEGIAADSVVRVTQFSDYWGRRGPSVHLSYKQPSASIIGFYNEVTVPEGEDPIGSYFMANGFAEGYFGMQVNSESERRVLFSVWSPFDTQNPKDIPAEYQVKLLRKGAGVHVGEFGDEGSGGQSYMIYPWKAGNTYRFFTEITPDKKGNTIYTSYFYAPEVGDWRLVASFLRPKTDTYYKRAHSFLENFIPEQGYLGRRVFFPNSWFCDIDGNWTKANTAIFSYDATARAGVRADYAGGVVAGGELFFLNNGGFFNNATTAGSSFRTSTTSEVVAPLIDFDKLHNL